MQLWKLFHIDSASKVVVDKGRLKSNYFISRRPYLDFSRKQLLTWTQRAITSLKQLAIG